MTECWNRFDRKTALCFTGNKDTRVPSLKKELNRVGLVDAEIQWQFPSPLDKILLRGMRHAADVECRGYFNSSMGHYRAIATSYHLGCEHCLILEDDIRFYKDLSKIEECIDSIPEDYDIALLDCFFRHWKPGTVNAEVMQGYRDNRKVNEFWSEFDKLYSLGCYALSRRGMERMMFCFEAVETAKRIGKMRIGDHYLNRDMLGSETRMYFCRKNVAIQRDVGRSNSKASDITNKYISMGLDLSEYEEA